MKSYTRGCCAMASVSTLTVAMPDPNVGRLRSVGLWTGEGGNDPVVSTVDALSANEGSESFVLGREEQSDEESESETTLFDRGRPSASKNAGSSVSREWTREWGCEGRRG